jgi:hypothetical protein
MWHKVTMTNIISLDLPPLSPPNVEHNIPYIIESNPHSVFGDFFKKGKGKGKRSVCDSNPHLSFNRPLPTGRRIE